MNVSTWLITPRFIKFPSNPLKFINLVEFYFSLCTGQHRKLRTACWSRAATPARQAWAPVASQPPTAGRPRAAPTCTGADVEPAQPGDRTRPARLSISSEITKSKQIAIISMLSVCIYVVPPFLVRFLVGAWNNRSVLSDNDCNSVQCVAGYIIYYHFLIHKA